uniref:Uncharacterized protein n=1 Tax=Onchocerca volvulus TaxID=6282 RepID=A0A8R1TUK0_ONCVO
MNETVKQKITTVSAIYLTETFFSRKMWIHIFLLKTEKWLTKTQDFLSRAIRTIVKSFSVMIVPMLRMTELK